MAPKIFLAHAREDNAQVRKLYADLKARGLHPWLDKVDLIPGQNWEIEIPKAIRDAGIFLACLSSRSVGKVGYIQNEFRLALSAFGKRPPGSIFLIPVRLDDCEVPDLQDPDLGLRLRAIHWVDLWEEDGFDRLVRAIEHALGIATPPEASREEASTREAKHRAEKETRAQAKPVAAKLSAGGEPKRQPPPIASSRLPGISASAWKVAMQRREARERAERIEARRRAKEPARSPTASRYAPPWRPELVVIDPGTFLMGSTEAERQWAVEQGANPARVQWERPQHEVRIDYGFEVARYPVTFEEYDHFAEAMGREKPDDESWGRGRRPVINVSWKDAKAYVDWLSDVTGEAYRLPSEAEWEYACRAGTTTRHSWGDEKPTPEQANFGENVGKTTEVGAYPANPWGLYDMHGNVWEWVEDCWHDSYEGAPSDGSAWTSGGDKSRQVQRGGSWNYGPRGLRSAFRVKNLASDRLNDWGFRVARTLR